MRDDSGRPQHPTAEERRDRVGRNRVKETGRDIGDGDHDVTPPRQGFAPYPGANSPGGTADDQQTGGSHHAGATKITSKEQGEADRRGSAGASGPPGRSPQRPGQQR